MLAMKWKTLEVKFHIFHEMVAIRHREGQLPEWSVDPFHRFIYRDRMGRWLSQHGRQIQKNARSLVSDIALQCDVFPSDQIVTGKALASRKKRPATSVSGGRATSVSGGQSTMASPVWLILFVLAPNCTCNPKARIKQHIAQRAFSMLEILAVLACQGHSASSASGLSQDALTLQIDKWSATVQADGSLLMDSTWSAWRSTWSAVEAQGNLVPTVQVKPDSVAGALWLWSRIVIANQVGSIHVGRSVLSTASKVVCGVLKFLQVGLSKWAMEQEEPSTAAMIASQPERRRTHSGILSRLLRTSRKGKAVKSWKDLGLKVETSSRSLNGRTAAKYIWTLRRLVLGEERTYWQPKRQLKSKQHPLASGVKRRRQESGDVHEQGGYVASKTADLPPLVVEVVWDSTNFASKDIQVNVVYCPREDVAAYTPPMSLRHIRWRSADAGERLSSEDREQFDKTGFKAKSRMEACDCIKYLNHMLQVAFGRSLLSFACPTSLKRMTPRSQGLKRHHYPQPNSFPV